MNNHTPFISLHPNARNITNQRFGKLIAIGPIGVNKHRHVRWLCKCDCGNETVVDGIALRSRKIQSCGCLREDMQVAKHGAHHINKHPLGRIWYAMMKRCHDPSDKDYKNYGARGITVCPEWRENFPAFCEYVSSLPHCKEDGYTIDRIDNMQGYMPGNVRWATPTQQSRNKRDNRLLTYNGETKCVAHWAADLGIKKITLYTRLKLGWPIEKVLSQKVAVKKR